MSLELLTELSRLLTIKHTVSHYSTYPLRVLKIPIHKIDRRLRRDWTQEERMRIREIIEFLVEPETVFNHYYYLLYKRVIEALYA
jgi:hypothetical protein